MIDDKCPKGNLMCDIHGDCPNCGKDRCGHAINYAVYSDGERFPVTVVCLDCHKVFNVGD
jgi:hypothetical protein